MFNYNWITTKYYLDKNEEIKEIKIPYWQHSPFISYNNAMFYFLINNSFTLNNNVNSLFVASYQTPNFNDYLTYGEEKKLFPLSLNDYSGKSSFIDDFLYLRNSSFIKFFINNMIDVPVCFKKSHSLRTKNFELPLLKFSNFLMKKGKKEKIIRLLFSSFREFFKTLKIKTINTGDLHLSWLNLYFFTTNTFWSYNSQNPLKTNFFADTNFTLNNNSNLIDNIKNLNPSNFLKNYFFSLLSKVSPVFSYFIYSVDKNIRKYSRGRSGKYTFIWKYVAPYKRTNLSMRWIVKDVKFYQSYKLSDRLIKTFTNLMLSPEKSFSWKSKIFSHNYVFKNFRKSLMTSLRTTS